MEKPTGKSKHVELTIDEIVEVQPGLGRLMPEIGDAYWHAFYAAKALNFPLAQYFVKKVESLMRTAALLRPKYAKMLEAFSKGSLGPLFEAIEAKDFSRFEAAYRRGIEVANRMHAEANHPEIVWRLPDEPPKELDLAPREPA
jgi:hypothetical protein